MKRPWPPYQSPTKDPSMSSTQMSSETEPHRYTRGRLSRGKGLRKTTGCLTCRRRHVKCDECKPRCGPCTKRRVSCAYAASNGDRSKTPGALSASPSRSRRESDAEMYNDQTDVSLPSFTVVESMQPPGELSQHLPLDEYDQDRRDGGVNDEAIPSDVNPAARQTEDTSFQAIDQTIHSGLGEDSQSLTASKQVEHYAGANANASGTPRPNPSISSLLGPNSLDSIHSITYHVPSPAISYQPQLQFTADPGVGVESPTSRWLDLLIGDATLQIGPLPDWEYDANGLDVFGNSVAQSPLSNSGTLAAPYKPLNDPNSRHRNPYTSTENAYLKERIPYVGNQKREELAWKAIEPLELQPHEMILFRHYTEHISLWMDLLDPQRPFGTFIPHLAMHSVGLMNAILALSSCHLSINPSDRPSYAAGVHFGPNDALDYYLKTLHYSQRAMQYDTYKTSLELLAISMIISSYEMLSGSSANWGKHLEGVFLIQRSQIIHGDSGGLRQAVWWAWLCQDVWAAFREKRKPFTFWSPSRPLADLGPVEIAARSVYNFARVVGFCSRDAMQNGRDVATRILEADVLLQQLQEWKSFLTVEFNPLPMSSVPLDGEADGFPPVWVQPGLFGVAMQLYYCSLILVHLQRPVSGGLEDHLERRTLLRDCAKMVCGIAKALTDYASSIMSSQCLFIAGMTLEDEKQRGTVLELLDSCQRRSGWPSKSLGHDLSKIWQRTI